MHEPQRGQAVAERIGGVLHSAVAVEDDAGPRTPTCDSAVEGGQREARVLGGAEAPAEDPARIAVHDDGEIAPGAPDFQIGDIADPDLVRLRRQAIVLTVGDAGEEAVQPGMRR